MMMSSKKLFCCNLKILSLTLTLREIFANFTTKHGETLRGTVCKTVAAEKKIPRCLVVSIPYRLPQFIRCRVTIERVPTHFDFCGPMTKHRTAPKGRSNHTERHWFQSYQNLNEWKPHTNDILHWFTYTLRCEHCS